MHTSSIYFTEVLNGSNHSSLSPRCHPLIRRRREDIEHARPVPPPPSGTNEREKSGMLVASSRAFKPIIDWQHRESNYMLDCTQASERKGLFDGRAKEINAGDPSASFHQSRLVLLLIYH